MADPVIATQALRHPSSEDLLVSDQREAMLANGRRSAAGADIDPHPVVALFTPDANATWLLTELDPAEPDLAFGLCDLGLGFPELGYVSISELRTFHGPLGLAVEADQGFVADRPLSNHAAVAQAAGRITV